jgi:hypothetical protein
MWFMLLRAAEGGPEVEVKDIAVELAQAEDERCIQAGGVAVELTPGPDVPE